MLPECENHFMGNDMIRSGCVGNGQEGKDLKVGRPGKEYESIGPLGSSVFYLCFSKSKM